MTRKEIVANNRVLRSDLRNPYGPLSQLRRTRINWEGEAGKGLLEQLDDIIARLSRAAGE